MKEFEKFTEKAVAGLANTVLGAVEEAAAKIGRSLKQMHYVGEFQYVSHHTRDSFETGENNRPTSIYVHVKGDQRVREQYYIGLFGINGILSGEPLDWEFVKHGLSRGRIFK